MPVSKLNHVSKRGSYKIIPRAQGQSEKQPWSVWVIDSVESSKDYKLNKTKQCTTETFFVSKEIP